MEDQERQHKTLLYRAVARIAANCGTVQFLVLNPLFFAAWIGANTTIVDLDPYPFTFLLVVCVA